jgi:hypothetical protein
MATFKIDGTTYTPYPRNVSWERPKLANMQNGAPVFSSFYEAVITFPTMTTSLWNGIASNFSDGTTHSVMLPHPNTSSDTTFSGVYFELVSQERDEGLYVYNGQVRVKRVIVS